MSQFDNNFKVHWQKCIRRNHLKNFKKITQNIKNTATGLEAITLKKRAPLVADRVSDNFFFEKKTNRAKSKLENNHLKNFQSSPGFDQSECGKTKGCTMPAANSCYNVDGNIGASYQVISDNQIAFEIFGPANTTVNENVYVALGFSDDEKMVSGLVLKVQKYWKIARNAAILKERKSKLFFLNILSLKKSADILYYL